MDQEHTKYTDQGVPPAAERLLAGNDQVVPAESPPTNGRALQKLLQAYEVALDDVDRLPPFVFVRSRPWRPGIGGTVSVLPRPKWFLRWLTARHIRRTLVTLQRRYHAIEALHPSTDHDPQSDQKAVESYLASLPPVAPRIRWVVIGGFAIALGSRFLAASVSIVGYLLGSVDVLSDPNRKKQLEEVADTVSKLLDPTQKAFGDALVAITKLQVAETLAFSMGLATLSYAVLRPLGASLRLRRALFNCYSTFDQSRWAVPLRWSSERSLGIYRLERTVFQELSPHQARSLRSRPPAETPFDLLASVALILFIVAYAVDSVVYSFRYYFRPLHLAVGSVLLILCLIWLFTLYRAYRRRALEPQAEWFPFWVRLRESGLPVKVENPWRILVASASALALIVIYPFDAFAAYIRENLPRNEALGYALGETLSTGLLLFAPAAAVWTARVSRELSYLESREPRRGARWACLSALSIGAGWIFILPPLVTGYRLGRRVRNAQTRSGMPKRPCRPWLVSIGMLPLGFPLVALHCQRLLNGIWLRAGEAIDDPSEFCRSMRPPNELAEPGVDP